MEAVTRHRLHAELSLLDGAPSSLTGPFVTHQLAPGIQAQMLLFPQRESLSFLQRVLGPREIPQPLELRFRPPGIGRGACRLGPFSQLFFIKTHPPSPATLLAPRYESKTIHGGNVRRHVSFGDLSTFLGPMCSGFTHRPLYPYHRPHWVPDVTYSLGCPFCTPPIVMGGLGVGGRGRAH